MNVGKGGFVCPECGRSFGLKQNLTNHMHIHTDDFKCEFCGKGFENASLLARHVKGGSCKVGQFSEQI